MKTQDGGPAFPTLFRNDGDLNTTAPDGHVVPPAGELHLMGMSLRDYFAAQALPQAIAHELSIRSATIRPPDFRFGDVAMAAYVMADAMLAERAK